MYTYVQKMKYIVMIALFLSCSSSELSLQTKVEPKWLILEKAIAENWDQGRILQILGSPKEKTKEKFKEFWLYESSENGVQEWSFSFNIVNKRITYIGFNPTGSMDKEFTLEKILKRWKRYNCINKKSDWYMKRHTVYQDTYYICDGNRRINYNRYKEVSWIRIRNE